MRRKRKGREGCVGISTDYGCSSESRGMGVAPVRVCLFSSRRVIEVQGGCDIVDSHIVVLGIRSLIALGAKQCTYWNFWFYESYTYLYLANFAT